VIFRLKFATDAFLPALADPYAWIYKKAILDQDPHWYEKNILVSGPFKFASLRDRPIDKRGENPIYYHKVCLSRTAHRHLRRQARRIRVSMAFAADRAAMNFRPPACHCLTELTKALGDKITVQTSDCELWRG